MEDRFRAYLKDEKKPTRQKALTAKSYKNVDHSLKDQDTNCELATYGDALLKVAYCKILYKENVENITEEKKRYETDKVLVEVIAKHYNLIEYIYFDKNDSHIPRDYDYKSGGNDSPSKYIATAVEALLAAIYLDNNEDFGLVFDIARSWKILIDKSEKESNLL